MENNIILISSNENRNSIVKTSNGMFPFYKKKFDQSLNKNPKYKKNIEQTFTEMQASNSEYTQKKQKSAHTFFNQIHKNTKLYPICESFIEHDSEEENKKFFEDKLIIFQQEILHKNDLMPELLNEMKNDYEKFLNDQFLKYQLFHCQVIRSCYSSDLNLDLFRIKESICVRFADILNFNSLNQNQYQYLSCNEDFSNFLCRDEISSA